MGNRPSPEHSIDRIDSDGDYSPDNCKWSTRQEQVRNRRSNRNITYRGETLTLVEWSERFGLNDIDIAVASRCWLECSLTALTTPVKP